MMANSRQSPGNTSGGTTTEFLGIAFHDFSQSDALDEVRLLIQKRGFSYVVTPNVDHIVMIHKEDDPILANAYGNANMTLCDSRILAMLAHFSGINLAAVPGSNLTRHLLQTENGNWRCAVVGGDPALHAAIVLLYPKMEWLFYEPPMGIRHNPPARLKVAEFVEKASADVIFFAIGAPQSEIICQEIAERGRAKGVALCVGASLEFLVGVKKRAPYWMQRMALEWLYRLISEPRRLWRRYLMNGPLIFLIWWRWQRLKAARRPDGYDSSQSGGK